MPLGLPIKDHTAHAFWRRNMRNSRTGFKTLAIAGAFAIAVGACSGGATTAPSSAATSEPGTSSPPTANACGTDPITLNIWGGYPENDEVYKQAGAAFKATHPNVDFTVFSTDLRGFEQKLTTAIPSKTAGDVVDSDHQLPGTIYR